MQEPGFVGVFANAAPDGPRNPVLASGTALPLGAMEQALLKSASSVPSRFRFASTVTVLQQRLNGVRSIHGCGRSSSPRESTAPRVPAADVMPTLPCRRVGQGMTLFPHLRPNPNWLSIEQLILLQCVRRMSDSTADGLHADPEPLLKTVGLSKRYGDFLANDRIDIDIRPNQIHALLGENGAGKSTLVKAIYGLIQPSAGEMFWQGQRMVLSGPSEARARGIGMVFQHFSLFDNLTVAENVALGLDGRETFKEMSARLAQVSRDYGLPLDPKRQVWQLSVGERQRIEIVRALIQNPTFLILDEPTAVLTPQEADQLFVVLERLKAEGRAILYISHKLEEVKRLCDTATILRAGRKVATCNPRTETAASLARMMVGTAIAEVRPAPGRRTTVPRLVVNDLSLVSEDPHGVRLKHISLELKGGEILGIAGVAGNGQDELFAALSGERLLQEPGTIVIEGIACGNLSITQRRKLGAAFVPE